MTSYRISICSDVHSVGEYSVRLHDETERTRVVAGAFSPRHARLVARDLMDLMRAREPDSAFVFEFMAARSEPARARPPAERMFRES